MAGAGLPVFLLVFDRKFATIKLVMCVMGSVS